MFFFHLCSKWASGGSFCISKVRIDEARGQQGWRKALLKQWEEFACFGSNARISWKI